MNAVYRGMVKKLSGAAVSLSFQVFYQFHFIK